MPPAYAQIEDDYVTGCQAGAQHSLARPRDKAAPYTACVLSSGSTTELMPAANCCEKSGLGLRDDSAGDDVVGVEADEKNRVGVDEVGMIGKRRRRGIAGDNLIAIDARAVGVN